jgi:hypothetical protein
MGIASETEFALHTLETETHRVILEDHPIGAAVLELSAKIGGFHGTAAELLKLLEELKIPLPRALSPKALGKQLASLWSHIEAVIHAQRSTHHDNAIRYTLSPFPSQPASQPCSQ